MEEAANPKAVADAAMRAFIMLCCNMCVNYLPLRVQYEPPGKETVPGIFFTFVAKGNDRKERKEAHANFPPFCSFLFLQIPSALETPDATSGLGIKAGAPFQPREIGRFLLKGNIVN